MATTTAVTVPTSAERIRSACVRGQALLAIADSADAAPVNAPVSHLMPDGSMVIAVPVGDPVAEAAAAGGSASLDGGAAKLGPPHQPGGSASLDGGEAKLGPPHQPGGSASLDGGEAKLGPPHQPGVSAMLELTDHAPLRLRERVRALAWIRGRLHTVPEDKIAALLDQIAEVDPNPALLQVISPRSTAGASEAPVLGGADGSYSLLRLTPDSAVLADATGAESVSVDELLAARPDPFCAIEAHWLHHLDSAHPELVARLAITKLPPQLRRGRPRPLAVDRYGMWLRVEAPDGDHDVRLGFPRPVEDVLSLNRAVRVLVGCPFLSGLPPRRS